MSDVFGFTVSPVDAEDMMLREIADRRMTRDDVALTYALALRAGDNIDWATVNRAIIERWSLNALKYVKTQAWKRVQGA